MPLAGLDVAIVDADTGRECQPARFDGSGHMVNPTEAIGEIVGRNALDRFEGYYNNPEATEKRSRRGWYWSGDLGYHDESGAFFFAGRTIDWLRVDGENFASAPLERLFERFEPVSGVTVFGVPDERTVDDQVMAVLEVPDPGHLQPGRLRRVPCRPTRPRHQMGTPLRSRPRAPAGHGHQQGRQTGPSAPAVAR